VLTGIVYLCGRLVHDSAFVVNAQTRRVGDGGKDMPRRSVDYLKPKKFQDYLTLSELAEKAERDPSWIRWLEAEDRIPRAIRVKRGKISVRLWSPEQADEVCAIIATHHPGRPRSV
jgi:hypothetical protein